MATYNYTSGLGNTAAFQVSGKPFVTGGINCGDGDNNGPDEAHVQINFPNVTKWFAVSNLDDGAKVKIAFSVNGFSTGDYFELGPGAGASAQVYDIKCTTLYVSGSPDVSVMAGLTGIPTAAIKNNYSGSDGVG